jgi:hypothetical protein
MGLRKGGARAAQSQRLTADETDRPDCQALRQRGPNRRSMPRRANQRWRRRAAWLESPAKSPADGVDKPDDEVNSVDRRH